MIISKQKKSGPQPLCKKQNFGKTAEGVNLSPSLFRVKDNISTKTIRKFANDFSSPSRLDRDRNSCDILLYIREDIPSKILSIESKIEINFVEINLHKKKWLISCSYNQTKHQ